MGMYIPNMKSEQFYELCKEHGLKIIAVSVPPHGRLIDADALKAKQQEDADLFQGSTAYCDKCRRDEAMNAVANIVNAPTILEAEEDKHDNDDH